MMTKYFDMKKGAYSAITILFGLILVNTFGNPFIFFTIIMGIFLCSCFDRNSPLLYRVRELIFTAIICIALTPIAVMSGDFLPTAIVVTFLAVFISSMALAFGTQMTKHAYYVTAWILIAEALPGNFDSALKTSLGLFCGVLIYLIFMMFSRNDKSTFHNTSEIKISSGSANIVVTLKQHYSLHSPIFQFALIRSVATALAVCLGWMLFDHKPFWVAYAVFFVMKPGAGHSMKLGIERAIGTLVATILAYFTLPIFPGNETLLQGLFLLFLSATVAEGGRRDGLFIALLTFTLFIFFHITGADIIAMGTKRIFANFLGILIAISAVMLLKFWARKTVTP